MGFGSILVNFLETITGLGFAEGWSIWILGCGKSCGKAGKAVGFARGWGCGKVEVYIKGGVWRKILGGKRSLECRGGEGEGGTW